MRKKNEKSLIAFKRIFLIKKMFFFPTNHHPTPVLRHDGMMKSRIDGSRVCGGGGWGEKMQSNQLRFIESIYRACARGECKYLN